MGLKISRFEGLVNKKYDIIVFILRFSFILKDLGCQTTLVNKEVAEFSDVVFLAVKPHLIVTVIKEVMLYINQSKHLIVSVAAAITTEVIEAVSTGNSFFLALTNWLMYNLKNK